jgi:MerR-like DNA binding protein
MNGWADGRCPEGQSRPNVHVVGYADRRSDKVAEGGASMPGPKKRTVGRTTSRRPAAPAKRAKGLQCPECDFVARHAMGLGRHRSTRHGIVSGRQARRDSAGGWLTRREAARRAGVHYNTIRHWERTGKLRRSRRGGSRGALVSASDLQRLASGGARATQGPAPQDLARVEALERRFADLLEGLERLVHAARTTRRRPPGRRSASGRSSRS